MVDDSSVASSKVARAEFVTFTNCLMDCKRGSLLLVDEFLDGAHSLSVLDAAPVESDAWSVMFYEEINRVRKCICGE